MTDPAKPVRTDDAAHAGDADAARVAEHQRRARAARRGDGQPGAVPGRRRRLRHQPRTAGSPCCMAQRSRPRSSATRAGWRPTARRSTRRRSARATRPRSTSPTRALPRAAVAGRVQHARDVASPTTATAATSPRGDGLIIVDLSEVQARKPNPQVREISRLTWSNMTIPQIADPGDDQGQAVRRRGRRVLRATTAAASPATGRRVGAARIIDISDERKPFVVSNIRLAGPPAREPRGDRRRPGRAEPGAGLRRRTTATSRSARSRASSPAR